MCPSLHSFKLITLFSQLLHIYKYICICIYVHKYLTISIHLSLYIYLSIYRYYMYIFMADHLILDNHFTQSSLEKTISHTLRILYGSIILLDEFPFEWSMPSNIYLIFYFALRDLLLNHLDLLPQYSNDTCAITVIVTYLIFHIYTEKEP